MNRVPGQFNKTAENLSNTMKSGVSEKTGNKKMSPQIEVIG